MIPATPARPAPMPSQATNTLHVATQAYTPTHPHSDYRDDFVPENFNLEDPEYAASITHSEQIVQDQESDVQLRCWICFGDEIDSQGKWVNPCHCSLVSHEECLLAWINENQKGQSKKEVIIPFLATTSSFRGF